MIAPLPVLIADDLDESVAAVTHAAPLLQLVARTAKLPRLPPAGVARSVDRVLSDRALLVLTLALLEGVVLLGIKVTGLSGARRWPAAAAISRRVSRVPQCPR